MIRRPFEITVRVDRLVRTEARVTIHAEDRDEAKEIATELVCDEAEYDTAGKEIQWTEETTIDVDVTAHSPKLIRR